MGWRSIGELVPGACPTVLAVALVALGVGCAHSEAEWQAQIQANEALRAKLDAEQARAKKARTEGDESAAKLEELQRALRNAGVDAGKLESTLERQARAVEERRRRQDQLEVAKQHVATLRAKLGAPDGRSSFVAVRNNRITISFPAAILFGGPRDAISHEGRGLLLKVAEAVRADPSLARRSYQVVGHAVAARASARDKDPLDLSLARAREVLRVLVMPLDRGGGGLSPARWSAAGQGDADPLNTKDTPEAGQVNARCDIVLVPSIDETLDVRAVVP
jgi:chemotaxis protein MotB